MTAPPRLPELLLAALGARAELRDAALGDLAEEFAQRAQRDGIGAAGRWYYEEAIRTAPHLLRDSARGLRARDVAHLAGVAVTSLVFTSVIGAFFVTAVESVTAALGRPWSLGQFIAPVLPAAMLLVQLLTAAVAGYVAASLHPPAPLAGALSVSVLWSIIGLLMAAMSDRSQAGYTIASLLIIVSGTVAGGMLRVAALPSPGGAHRAGH